MKGLISYFYLDPKITYFNHGSFGACPKFIFDKYIEIQKKLEQNPVNFLDESIDERILKSQIKLAKFIDCEYDDIVFFPNPTTAINEVIKSLHLKKNDEILSTNQEYGALDKAWDYITKKTGSKYIKIKIPNPLKNNDDIYDLFKTKINNRTKVLYLSHMTSVSGLILPVKRITNLARKFGILSIIDGAHAPGHIDLSIKDLNPDIYTGTCHKWLLTPKGVSFLYVKKRIQKKINPLIISWGYNNKEIKRTKFQDEHLWQGTRNMSSYLTINRALQFREIYKWDKVSELCKNRILKFGEEIQEEFDFNLFCSLKTKFLGQMLSFDIKLTTDKINLIYSLLKKDKIIIPIFERENKLIMRISINGYNSDSEIKHLLSFLKKIKKL